MHATRLREYFASHRLAPERQGVKCEIRFSCAINLGLRSYFRKSFALRFGVSRKLGSEIVADLKRLRAEFPGALFYVDSTGHRGYIADFAPADLPITETQFSREKEKWVGGMQMLLQMGRLRIPDPDRFPGLSAEQKAALRKLLQQTLQFVRVVKQTGGIEFRHPPGEHDDGVDALMLATMRLATRLQETMGAKGTRDKVGRLTF